MWCFFIEENISVILYVYKGKNHKGAAGEALVKRALADYTNFKGDTPVIKRGKHGKPFFENVPVSFSISHSGEIWVCLMADSNVGVDIQLCKNVKYEKISERFFTKNEVEFIKKQGIKSFFEVWTKKEAFVKYTGNGFSNQPFSNFSVVKYINDEYLCKKSIEDAYIQEFIIPLDMLNKKLETKLVGAICTQKKEEMIIKEL